MTVVTGKPIWKIHFINEILFKGLANYFGANEIPGKYDSIGIENVDKVIGIDQSPIGRTPRSNAATYVNAFTPIRELLCQNHYSQRNGL